MFISKSKTLNCGWYKSMPNELFHRRPQFRQRSDLTLAEASTALRPFYFKVHPDKFWQHPREKNVNENSLKILRASLDAIISKKSLKLQNIPFYLKKDELSDHLDLKEIKITLSNDDHIKDVVIRVLKVCKLSTDHLHLYLAKDEPEQKKETPFTAYKGNMDVFWIKKRMDPFRYDTGTRVEGEIKRQPKIRLKQWLMNNIEISKNKSEECEAIRDDIGRLCEELKKDLNLKDLIIVSDWSASHVRGGLISLRTLCAQHVDEFSIVSRVLVFGNKTGISCDGHVVLNLEDVRHNWLNLLRSIEKFDNLLKNLPLAEEALSDALCGIQVDHRKFGPSVMINAYFQDIVKLATTIQIYKTENHWANNQPEDLRKFRIIVESVSGPLMLSLTGQFVVPSGCPAKLLFAFIDEHYSQAERLLGMYKGNKHIEKEIINRCMAEFCLKSLKKSDDISPNIMINCCDSLLRHFSSLSDLLRSSRLKISNYYSVLQDGEITIPWNWIL